MNRPLELPKYVLLSTGNRTRQLSYDVAQEMARMDQTVYIDAFEAPLAEAFRAMWDKDFHKDYTDPRSSAALVLEAGDKSEREIIESLRLWFEKEFGTGTLGKMALKRAQDQQSINEYIYVLHDAFRVEDHTTFSKVFKSRDLMIFDLTAYPVDANITEIVLDMEAAWEKQDA